MFLSNYLLDYYSDYILKADRNQFRIKLVFDEIFWVATGERWAYRFIVSCVIIESTHRIFFK